MEKRTNDATITTARFIPTDSRESLAIVHATEPTTVPASTTDREVIEQRWQTLVRRRSITENATLLRYISHGAGEVVVQSDVTYRDVIGHRYLAERLVPASFQVISALAIVRTADNMLVLRERDSGDWPHSYECPGGFLRSYHTFATIDDFLLDRVEREIPGCSTISYSHLGWFNAQHIAEMMTVYEVQLVQTAAELTQETEASIRPIAYDTLPAVLADETTILPRPLHAPTREVLHGKLLGELV